MLLGCEVEVIAAVVIVEVFVDSGNSLVVGFVFSTVVADAGISVLDLWVGVVLWGVVDFSENRHKIIIYTAEFLSLFYFYVFNLFSRLRPRFLLAIDCLLLSCQFSCIYCLWYTQL